MEFAVVADAHGLFGIVDEVHQILFPLIVVVVGVDKFQGFGFFLHFADFELLLAEGPLLSFSFFFSIAFYLHTFEEFELLVPLSQFGVDRLLQILQIAHNLHSFLNFIVVFLFNSGEFDVVVRDGDVA